MLGANWSLVGSEGSTTLLPGRGTPVIATPQRGDGKRNTYPAPTPTRDVPLSPAYATILRAQERNRHQPLYPFPVNMTAEQAALDEINRAAMSAVPQRVQQPPYNIQPASGQSRTFTDATVSSSQITLPAMGAYAVVVTFQVPSGRNGVIDAISNQLTVGGFQDGSGNALWYLTVNGMVHPGFNNVKASLGTMSNTADLSDRKIRVYENDVVQLLIFNVNLTQGQGIIQGLLGVYWYPIGEEFESLA